MYYSRKDRKRILKQFCAYAWRLLRNELYDAERENREQLDHEVSLTDLVLEIPVYDCYFAADHQICVHGIWMELDDATLVEAIRSLDQQQQAIIALHYIMNL